MNPEPTSTLSRALFLDRDGVLNRRIVGGYVRTIEEFELIDGVIEFLAEAQSRGYKLIVITNQRGVGLGKMSEDDLRAIHQHLSDLLKAESILLTGIYSCLDKDDSSPRRKPSPAMILEAAADHDISLENSWMIGDSHSDIEAGKAAGTRTAFLLTLDQTPDESADVTLQNLRDLLPLL